MRVENAGVAQVDSVRRAAGISAVLIVAGTVLGFVRDLLMAHRFGAGSGTDAFLVAWTIPETASPLLIEDAMALLMVPVLSRALADHGGVRALVAATLPKVTILLATAMGLVVMTAPALVDVLAPGLDDRERAITCMRMTSLTVLTFGLAGFMSATLRAHHRFGPPAAIYAAYNVGILAVILTCDDTLGVTAAALGVAAGSLLMIVVQAPAFLRSLHRTAPGLGGAMPAGLAAAVAPVIVYTVTRQAQVFVERHFGAGLAEGSISHLNYAQKVAQVPMVLSLLVVTVTFPRLARAWAAGDAQNVRRRIESDVAVVGTLVLAATAYLVAFAPTVIGLLFEHGRFTHEDTEATAAVMRVYALGLLGQALVGVLTRVFYAAGRPCWYPAWAVAAGLALTALLAAMTASTGGTAALAAANAAGITATALLLLSGLRRRMAPMDLRAATTGITRSTPAACAAAVAGFAVERALGGHVPAFPLLVVGLVVVAAVFGLGAAALGAEEPRRALVHARSRLTEKKAKYL
ncbi:lipid II flippase MurJ [Thermomonospora umbrina]|uniref:Putative peptidoglycan lipid II flippase n=1 Tax=Thermomonospora umbrina TaxID=111806 RepID=A0A3D9SP78_9ACTN|nr:lipid II flippase MurJ [Thermomonospora umbrina]REE97708.1 putative peptidoglycan lipid II flippase [Thermomonospora umbrina]